MLRRRSNPWMDLLYHHRRLNNNLTTSMHCLEVLLETVKWIHHLLSILGWGVSSVSTFILFFIFFSSNFPLTALCLLWEELLSKKPLFPSWTRLEGTSRETREVLSQELELRVWTPPSLVVSAALKVLAFLRHNDLSLLLLLEVWPRGADTLRMNCSKTSRGWAVEPQVALPALRASSDL